MISSPLSLISDILHFSMKHIPPLHIGFQRTKKLRATITYYAISSCMYLVSCIQIYGITLDEKKSVLRKIKAAVGDISIVTLYVIFRHVSHSEKCSSCNNKNKIKRVSRMCVPPIAPVRFAFHCAPCPLDLPRSTVRQCNVREQ